MNFSQKALPAGQNSGQPWDKKIVRNLGFIRKKLRYPLSMLTVLPYLVITLMTMLIVVTLYIQGVLQNESNNNKTGPLIALSVLFITICILVKRSWNMLHFKAIPTSFYSTENQALLLRFLQSQHFAFARHPEAPEVFQIMSRSISALQDEREIIVFIADDRRILINSHFSYSRFRPSVGPSHRQQIAGMLQSWIAAQNTGSGIIPV